MPASSAAAAGLPEQDAAASIVLPARPEPLRLDPERTALIVVDMQNAYASKGGYVDEAGFDVGPAAGVIPRIAEVVEVARAAGMPVIFLQNGWDSGYAEAGTPLSPNWHKSNALKTMRARPDLMKRAEPASPAPSRPGEGRAEVSTARGPLVHAVRIADGVLADYRIETPTAARFAPGKDADRLLADCHDAGSVRWVMQALDPCVGWQTKEAA